MSKKEYWPVFSLIVLALLIGLAPRMPIGTFAGVERVIDIRGEDLWILVLAMVWGIAYVKGKTEGVQKLPLFWPILAWTGIGLAALLLNIIAGNVNALRGSLYFAKEVQFFFVYAYTFFYVRSLASSRMLLFVWVGIGVANSLWVLWQLFSGNLLGEYGTAALNEWGVFPTGAFFLLLFVFLFNWWLYAYWRQDGKKRLAEYALLAAILLMLVGLLGTLSRTVFVAFWFQLGLSMLLYLWRKKTARALFDSVVLFCTVSCILFAVYVVLVLPLVEHAPRLLFIVNEQSSPTDVLSPARIAEEAQRTRIDSAAAPQFQQAVQDPLLIVFGHGKGAILGGAQESHNQYLRNFVETGIVGSIAFLALMAMLLRIAWKGFRKKADSMTTGLSAGVLAATCTLLFISIVVDAFAVVKPNMTYWFFVGLMAALLYREAGGLGLMRRK